jgi:hypothetical protein
MRIRLVGAVAAALSIAFVGAWPALAQEGRDRIVDVELTSPSEGVYAGNVPIAGSASSPAGIKRVELFVDDLVIATQQPNDYRREVPISFDWDSRFAPNTQDSLANGRYVVGIRAVANGERSAEEASVTIAVDNVPARPRGLTVDVEGAGVSLKWAPNPEPDLLYYLVQRDSGAGYETISKRKATGYYEIADAGAHLYRVIAVRRSPTIASGQTSLPSRGVTATISPDAANDGGGFEVDGRESSGSGLPSGGLPDLSASDLPPLPGAGPAGPDRLGDFEGRLPYGEMKVPAEFRLVRGADGDGRDRWWNVIPPDGLRWVAAGALLIVMSLQARLLARRLTPSAP